MNKLKFVFISTTVPLLLSLLAGSVIAQEETPPPYAELKNPFPWDDTSAQETGKGIYRQFCTACHGIDGSNIPAAKFDVPDFPQKLEERPDFYFWTVSEGRPSGGMPTFKSSLSAEQRWQLLTYLRSLGTVAPPAPPPKSGQPPLEVTAGNLYWNQSGASLTVPEQGKAGQPMTFSVFLLDEDHQPIVNTPVTFLTKVDFFINGMAEIGEAITDERGKANLEYIARRSGEITIVARYGTVEIEDTVILAEAEDPFYQTEAGLHFPGSGSDILIGPKSAFVVGEGGDAPMTGLRIPPGLKSGLLMLYVGAVILVWTLYLYAMSQVLRISVSSKLTGTNTKLIPLFGIAAMSALVIMLVLILITYPYSHSHLYVPN